MSKFETTILLAFVWGTLSGIVGLFVSGETGFAGIFSLWGAMLAVVAGAAFLPNDKD